MEPHVEMVQLHGTCVGVVSSLADPWAIKEYAKNKQIFLKNGTKGLKVAIDGLNIVRMVDN